MKFKNLLISAVLLVPVVFNAGAKDYKAVIFGVKADGITLNTASIQRAIDQISAEGGGTLYFYVGRYVTGSFELRSNVNIFLDGGAVLVFSPNAFDAQGAMIHAEGQRNMKIYGEGTIEGSAGTLGVSIDEQAAKGHIDDPEGFRPPLLSFKDCSGVSVTGIIFQNPVTDAVRLDGCSGVTLEKLSFFATDVPADAISVKGCSGVKVSDSYFDVRTPLAGDRKGVSISGCRQASGKKVK